MLVWRVTTAKTRYVPIAARVLQGGHRIILALPHGTLNAGSAQNVRLVRPSANPATARVTLSAGTARCAPLDSGRLTRALMCQTQDA